MKKNIAGRVAAALILLVLLLGNAAPAQADFPTPAVPGWKLEYLEHPRNFSNFSHKALAFDDLNHPHIVYGGDGLYHAWYNGVFHVEVVDPGVNVGQHASIAISKQGHIHIAYYDAGRGDLKYATNISGGWTTQTVVSAGDVGTETAIFVDSDDVPYILYKDETHQKLMFICGSMNFPMVWDPPEIASGSATYVYNFSMVMKNNLEVFLSFGEITPGEATLLHYSHRSALGQWSDTVIDSGNLSDYIGHESAIDLDSLGRPWIVYTDNNSSLDLYLVRVAHWTGSSWYTSSAGDTLELAAGAGSLAMAINHSNNHLYLAYQGEGNNLYFTEWDGANWINDWEIEADGDTGDVPSMALDSANLPGVSYNDGLTTEVHYRKKTDATQAGWSALYHVDLSQDTGACPVVKLDRWDRPHVVYFDRRFQTLRYREYSAQWSAVWSVDAGRAGQLTCQSALVLTGVGLPRVAYSTLHSLYYAYGGSPFNGFTGILIDSDDAASFEFVSMALDSDSFPHIVYVKNEKLYQAFDDGTGWLIEAIRDKPTQTQLSAVMTSPALAIDANNNLYLAFSTYSGLDFITRTSAGWQTVQHVSTSLPWNGISLVIAPPGLPVIAAAYTAQNGNPDWIGLSSFFCFITCSWPTQVVNTAVQNETIDNFTNVALAVDSQGALVISYFDDDNLLPNGLVVARHVGSQWVNRHIDYPVSPGIDASNSLALTASGRARIAYYDAISRDPRFARELNQTYIPTLRK